MALGAEGARRFVRGTACRRAFRTLTRGGTCLAALGLALGCVPMPVHWTPSVSGQVVDADTGRPLADAVVVVRFDARHGDLLPDRDLLRHREALTDAGGRFRIPRGVAPGLTAWPMVSTEARVVSVMRPGYRCGSPHAVESGPVTLRLEASQDEAERRASCRPVAARPSEAPEYLTAWRALYPRDGRAGRMVDERPLERLLEARRVFGPGQNCGGPVVDLALSPDGERAALAVEQAGHRGIEVIELGDPPRRLARLAAADEPDPARPRRIAWAARGELVLWDPADALDRALSSSSLGALGGAPQVIWRGGLSPAKRAEPLEARLEPIEPADRNDLGDARWNGRAFHLTRSLDPATGLASETLHTLTSRGDTSSVPLPGESCGPGGQYGRPQQRIASDGERGLDLRYLDGGCRAVAIHLTQGSWSRLDTSRAEGSCRETRRVPLTQLRAAMRGYVRDLEDVLRAAGGDPNASYVLHVSGDGRTTLESRDYLGDRLDLVVPAFPIETPLRRIDVTAVANAGSGSAEQPPASPDPVLEPL